MAVTRDPRAIGVPGLALVIVGALLLMLSFTALTWYGSSAEADSIGRITFSKLHTVTHAIDGGSRAPRWYFSWVAWVLLLAVILVGLLANLPLPGGLILRVLGLLIGVGGTVATWYSLHQLFAESDHGVLDNAKIGLWFALIGYPVAGLGALIGPLGAAKVIPATAVVTPEPAADEPEANEPQADEPEAEAPEVDQQSDESPDEPAD